MCTLTFSRSCFRYHKGTDFQANHNGYRTLSHSERVVLDTTKVQIFKQITTGAQINNLIQQLFQIPQRYRFSSKSQLDQVTHLTLLSCFRYHKGTDFQANHNRSCKVASRAIVVLDTTKVQIFKQITTTSTALSSSRLLFQIPQRYRFSSKSQPLNSSLIFLTCCFRYHKGTDFQANHNTSTTA